jgi:hypothetical protein
MKILFTKTALVLAAAGALVSSCSKRIAIAKNRFNL